MKARLVRIGNLRGVRLPKPLIEEAGLTDEVEVRVRAGAVIIMAARRMRHRSGHRLPDEPVATRFDHAEWRWE